MGINSGTVVVGKIGDDLRMDYTAQGHIVGLAQRMEQLAEPGTICVTEHTRRLVEGYFQVREMGSFTIKGARAPIEVAALEGLGQLRTRLDVMAESFAFQFRGELAALLGDKAASERDLRSAAAVFRHLECGARAEWLEQRVLG